jgi:hypothetical protein
MPVELCSSSGLRAAEYPVVERLVFACHSSLNEEELNPELLCSGFHFLFATHTEHVPENHTGSALDSGTEPVKIAAGDKRAGPSIGLKGLDELATHDILVQWGSSSWPQRNVWSCLSTGARGTFPSAASTLAIPGRHFLRSRSNKHSTPSAPMSAVVDI